MFIDLLIDAHPTQAFSCAVCHAGEYCPQTIDGDLYIVGVKPPKDKKVYYIEKRNSTILLHSLLLLCESLTPGTYAHAEKITEQDVNCIIQWCNEYGMPMEERDGTLSISANSIWMKYRKVGFHVGTFINRLNDIYICYLLWRKLYLHDTSSENYYVANHVSSENCLEFLTVRMLTLDVRFTPDFSITPPSFQMTCPDLVEVAKAQMYFECMSTDSFSIGICSVCGASFVKTRKNNMLCEKCQSTKYKRTREKQRMLKNSKVEGE